MPPALDSAHLYRLPWNLPDNGITWLEVTAACNLACLGCYRANKPNGHKSLAALDAELDVMQRLRRTDAMSIAGGDPLMHPDIVEVVKRIARRGIKPILNTNGLALTRELLVALKRAGLAGVTFHVDSRQGRPHWKDATETDLNALRLEFAELVADVGGIACGFNATVYRDTLNEAPEIVAWGHRHMDIVHTIVFICFRRGELDGAYDYWVDGRKIDVSLPYTGTGKPDPDIRSTDVVAKLRERFPDFAPNAYLNGTEEPDAFKWLLTTVVGTNDRVYGYAGPRFMELMQSGSHWWSGHYLAYAKPGMLRHGRSGMLLSAFDPGTRAAAKAWLGALARNPARAFGRVRYQSVAIIQPADMLTDGRVSMCDGCPDVTVWNGRLVWSCRLEEPMRYGGFMRAVPKEQAVTHD